MEVFYDLESRVRSYSRAFPVVFETGSGPFLYDSEGRRYLDFLCGAGSLCYGHNPPGMKQALVEYLLKDGVVASLDLATGAKRQFLQDFSTVILRPRGLDYRVQFTGPTGANAVEAALKIARKVTGRSHVMAFTNGYHGLSSGALAVTAHRFYHHETYSPKSHVSFLPFDGYFGPEIDTIDYIERLLDDPASGIPPAAAVIVETVQGVGGVNVAGAAWLRRLEALCRRHGMLLIIDDILAGCGRTGTFFSFETAGLRPDIVVLSKGLSGYGLPLSAVLLRPDLDQWKPGEHTGTFRGNGLAMVTAAKALAPWKDAAFGEAVTRKGALLRDRLRAIGRRFDGAVFKVRGQGLLCGLELGDESVAAAVARAAFARGLMIERCGSRQNVLKFLPPLDCADEVLLEADGILEAALEECLAGSHPTNPLCVSL